MSYSIRTPDTVEAEAALLTPADFEGVDGVLLSAKLCERFSKSQDRTVQFVWGYIFGDAKGRFAPGTFIRTTDFVGEPEGDVYKTLNSTYRIRFRQETDDDAG